MTSARTEKRFETPSQLPLPRVRIKPYPPVQTRSRPRHPDCRGRSNPAALDLQKIVDAGRGAFDTTAVGTLLNGALFTVNTLRSLECDSFIL